MVPGFCHTHLSGMLFPIFHQLGLAKHILPCPITEHPAYPKKIFGELDVRQQMAVTEKIGLMIWFWIATRATIRGIPMFMGGCGGIDLLLHLLASATVSQMEDMVILNRLERYLCVKQLRSRHSQIIIYSMGSQKRTSGTRSGMRYRSN